MTSDNWEGLRCGGVEGGNNTDINLELKKDTNNRCLCPLFAFYFMVLSLLLDRV